MLLIEPRMQLGEVGDQRLVSRRGGFPAPGAGDGRGMILHREREEFMSRREPRLPPHPAREETDDGREHGIRRVNIALVDPKLPSRKP